MKRDVRTGFYYRAFVFSGLDALEYFPYLQHSDLPTYLGRCLRVVDSWVEHITRERFHITTDFTFFEDAARHEVSHFLMNYEHLAQFEEYVSRKFILRRRGQEASKAYQKCAAKLVSDMKVLGISPMIISQVKDDMRVMLQAFGLLYGDNDKILIWTGPGMVAFPVQEKLSRMKTLSAFFAFRLDQLMTACFQKSEDYSEHLAHLFSRLHESLLINFSYTSSGALARSMRGGRFSRETALESFRKDYELILSRVEQPLPYKDWDLNLITPEPRTLPTLAANLRETLARKK